MTREREAGGLCCQRTLPIQNQCLSLTRGWGEERMKREYSKECFQVTGCSDTMLKVALWPLSTFSTVFFWTKSLILTAIPTAVNKSKTMNWDMLSTTYRQIYFWGFFSLCVLYLLKFVKVRKTFVHSVYHPHQGCLNSHACYCTANYLAKILLLYKKPWQTCSTCPR